MDLMGTGRHYFLDIDVTPKAITVNARPAQSVNRFAIQKATFAPITVNGQDGSEVAVGRPRMNFIP